VKKEEKNAQSSGGKVRRSEGEKGITIRGERHDWEEREEGEVFYFHDYVERPFETLTKRHKRRAIIEGGLNWDGELLEYWCVVEKAKGGMKLKNYYRKTIEEGKRRIGMKTE